MDKQNVPKTIVLIKRKSSKKVAARYSMAFEDNFEAITWGEKQAKEYGNGYYAELG